MANDAVVLPPEGRQIDKLIAPIAEHMHIVQIGPVEVGVEYRVLNDAVLRDNYGGDDDPNVREIVAGLSGIEDRGIALHVYDAAHHLERLRFDAFGDWPHYHYVFADGSHKRMEYDTAANGRDMLPWAYERLRSNLGPMLRRAGADELAALVDPASLDEGVRSIATEAARLLASPPSGLGG
jgi:hypothetical protein